MPSTDTSGTNLLLLMRHAKSSWDDPQLDDHDRPLNQRGERDAPRMAELLRDQNLVPKQVISSSALRAHSTGRMIAEALKLPAPQIIPRLYHASPAVWQDVFANTKSSGLTLWIGHNPGLEELVQVLTGQQIRLPTAAIVLIQKSADDSPWKLMNVWRPKELIS